MTDRPPIIAHYPGGVLKAFCPCGAVIIRNPAVSSETETTCGFCARRYQWAEPARASGVDDTRKGASVPSPHRSDTATASTLEARARSAIEDFGGLPVVPDWTVRECPDGHPSSEAPALMSRGAAARSCQHSPEQIGGRRCVRCCTARDLVYVWRKSAGGSPGAFRWLCAPCEAVYAGLGLVGEHRGHVETMANRARPPWVEAAANA